MKTLITTLCVVILTVCAAADSQPATSPAVATELASSAEKDLAKSVQDLNKLRDEIAKEKVPLSEDLSKLEDRQMQLRKEYTNVARLGDSGSLEIANLKTEMKARQDELAYVSNLLDEYARTYDTKVNVCELQYLGKTIDAAKEASANTVLTADEKFTRQLALVDVSMKRLVDGIGGMRFDGAAVDMDSTVVEGKFAILGPVALFSSKSGTAGLVVPKPGSIKPLIRPLEGEMQKGLASLVDNGEGVMPLDPSRGAALKALIQKTNIMHIFKKGGPIMYPLLVASILSLLTVLERLSFLFMERLRRDPKALSRFFTAIGEGRIEEAMIDGEKSKFFVVRSLAYALRHKEESLASALMYAQSRELKRFRRGIPILDTVITLAPLLGLLGTVTGMMGSFSLLGGELNDPGAITGGIAEALIATAFGLGIAITSLIPFNALNNRIEVVTHDLQSAGTQLELLVPPSMRRPAPAPAAPRVTELEEEDEGSSGQYVAEMDELAQLVKE